MSELQQWIDSTAEELAVEIQFQNWSRRLLHMSGLEPVPTPGTFEFPIWECHSLLVAWRVEIIEVRGSLTAPAEDFLTSGQGAYEIRSLRRDLALKGDSQIVRDAKSRIGNDCWSLFPNSDGHWRQFVVGSNPLPASDSPEFFGALWGSLMGAYQIGVNPLPKLRELYPELTWKLNWQLPAEKDYFIVHPGGQRAYVTYR